MRTTLTIEDSVDRKLKELAFKTGKSYKQVVNETLKKGLSLRDYPKQEYSLTPRDMGEPAAGYNLDKALALAGDLEDQDITEKMRRGK